MTTMDEWLPAGSPRVTPRLFVEQPAECVTFIKEVFRAGGEFVADRPTELELGDSRLMISKSGPREATKACLYVYVPDVDAAYERALLAGAVTIEEPIDLPYGDRRAMVSDPWGTDWQIATHRE